MVRRRSSRGVAIFPSALNGSPCSASNPCGVFSVNRNFRPSYNENYSFNIERTLAPNVIAQIGYVGSEGRRLLSLLDINQGTSQASRPYFTTYPQYGNINQLESIGTSNYNALQGQLRVANWHRLSSSVAYTWGHNLDEVTAYRGALPQNSYNFKGDYGNSDFDTRNSVTAFVSYELRALPTVRGSSPEAGSSIRFSAFHGGQPFSVAASGDISGTNEGNDRADQIGPIRRGYLGQHPNVNWVDPTAFADPAPGTFGTSRPQRLLWPRVLRR